MWHWLERMHTWFNHNIGPITDHLVELKRCICVIWRVKLWAMSRILAFALNQSLCHLVINLCQVDDPNWPFLVKYVNILVIVRTFCTMLNLQQNVNMFFSQKHLRCLGSRLVVETAWERYARDESADGTVMLPCYVWSCWGAAAAGRETAERMCGRCCYRGMWSCWGLATVLMLFAAVGGRCCGDEAADDAVTLLFAAVGGIDVRERECGDESADDAVAMLFAAVGGGCWGARLRRRICGRCCYPAICSCWG